MIIMNILLVIYFLPKEGKGQNFPFATYQYTLEPYPSSRTFDETSHTTTVPLPQLFSSSWNREVCISGLHIYTSNILRYELQLQFPYGNTQQGVIFRPRLSTSFYKLSYYIILVEIGNGIISIQDFFSTTTSIDNFGSPNFHQWQASTINSYATVTTGIFFFLRDGWSQSQNDQTNGFHLGVTFMNTNTVEITVTRMSVDQLIKQISLVAIFIEYTPIAATNYAYYIKKIDFDDNTNALISTSFDIVPPLYWNTTSGGFSRICFIGFQNIQIGGLVATAMERAFFVNTQSSPIATLFQPGSSVFTARTRTFCMTECPENTYFHNISCLPCMSNCLECTNASSCDLCNTTFGLNAGSTACVDCISLTGTCQTCINSTYCTSCANDSYGVSWNNTCLLCSELISNCLTCSNRSFCTECVNSTYFISNFNLLCLQCSSILSNCLTCSSSSTCTSCNSGFYLNGGGCIPCSDLISNCLQCTTNTPTTCTNCQYSFFIASDQLSCLHCSLFIPNCSHCSSSSYCDICIDGYAFNGVSQVCQPCSNIYPGCANCKNSECLSCDADKILAQSGQRCECLLGWVVQNLCTQIVGCVSPVMNSEGSNGCISCVQQTCNSVPGCIVSNGTSSCSYCNGSQHFKLDVNSSGLCECQDLFELKGSTCVDLCGDGFLVVNDGSSCDDGNRIGGDGCSSQCQTQISYTCRNGSSTSPSSCVYSGIPIELSLKRTQRTEGQNQGVFKFEIFPPLLNIGRMNLSSLVEFSCDAEHTISSVSYFNGILEIVTDFSTDLQEKSCNLTMSFDPAVIDSSTFAMSFEVESDDVPLRISRKLYLYQTIKFIFNILSYVVLGIFVLGMGHKMVGVQLLAASQIIYYSSFFYKYIPFFINPIEQYYRVAGYWFFYSQTYEEFMDPFTYRVRMSPYFLQIYFVPILVTLFIFAAFLVLQLYRSFKKERSEQRKFLQDIQTERRLTIWIKIIFNNLLFPLAVGFLNVFIISSFLQSKRFVNISGFIESDALNSAVHFISLVVIGVVIGVQLLFKNTDEEYVGGLDEAKNWYISMFLYKSVLLSFFILIFISNPKFYILGIFILGNLVYLVLIVLFRPYKSIFDSIGVYVCQISAIYSTMLALLSYFAELSEETWIFLVFMLQGLIIVASICCFIRLLIFYKGLISNKCLEQQHRSERIETTPKNEKKKDKNKPLSKINPYSLEGQNLLKKPLNSKKKDAIRTRLGLIEEEPNFHNIFEEEQKNEGELLLQQAKHRLKESFINSKIKIGQTKKNLN